MSSRENANVLWFDELHREDVNLVGGKSSSLGNDVGDGRSSAVWFCNYCAGVPVLYGADGFK